MKNPLFVKFAAIGGLVVLLLIAISMIGNVITERQNAHLSVLNDIAKSSSYSQTLVGPVMVVPYKKKISTWKVNDKKERYLEENETSGELHFLPEVFRLTGDLTTELRKRGIYEARLYHSKTKISGSFELPSNYGITENFPEYRFGMPYVAIGISDIRGIENSLKLKLNNQQFDFEPGSQLRILGDGIHATLNPLIFPKKTQVPFSIDMALQGTEKFNIAPIGKETHVELHSDWPHPSFVGDFLPVERTIDQSGFSARWQTSYFATNFAEYFKSCVLSINCDQYHERHFGVSMIDPIDQYVKSNRAIKYALLFIALTFAGFFLFEVLKRLAVHPIQYGLVGLALALFYLLLVSLSEHIGFELAYIIASVSCVLLIGTYVCYVLQSVYRGLGFTAGLALLYGMLYGLLSAEDYALLMGSVLLFSLLGVMMILTRKVDWYSFGKSELVIS